MMGRHYHKVNTGVMGCDGYVCCAVFVADFFMSGLAVVLMTYDIRNKLRMRWNIDPDANQLVDCCMVFWCLHCAQCQVQREMTYRGYWPGSMCMDNPHPRLLLRTLAMK